MVLLDKKSMLIQGTITAHRLYSFKNLLSEGALSTSLVCSILLEAIITSNCGPLMSVFDLPSIPALSRLYYLSFGCILQLCTFQIFLVRIGVYTPSTMTKTSRYSVLWSRSSWTGQPLCVSVFDKVA